jgi:nicotinate-nucleotide adenylyltransferase
MRLGYFGGTFDPPHLGHLAVAQAAAEAFALDRVLMVPTGVQPLRPVSPLAPFADRLAMVSLLCEQDRRLQPAALEAPRTPPVPNYTVDTLQQLLSDEPEGEAKPELFVIVGADAFQSLPLWRSPEVLLTLAQWIVVTRPRLTALELPPLTAQQRERVHLLRTLDNPASASAVRAALASRDPARGADLDSLLAPAVLAYIREHGLYESPRVAPGV